MLRAGDDKSQFTGFYDKKRNQGYACVGFRTHSKHGLEVDGGSIHQVRILTYQVGNELEVGFCKIQVIPWDLEGIGTETVDFLEELTLHVEIFPSKHQQDLTPEIIGITITISLYMEI